MSTVLQRFSWALLAIASWLLPNYEQAQALTWASINSVQPKYYIPVTLNNAQASATGTNLQVMVRINSNANSSYYTSNLNNTNWQDGKGNILKSWLETGETNTSNPSVYWINLGSNTIPANGSITIYQVIYDLRQTALDGTSTGAEPNFTATYGQNDNGANVFDQYGGKSWSNFAVYLGSWNTTNGYLQQTATSKTGTQQGGAAALLQTQSYDANGSYIIETAFNYSVQANARVGIVAVATPVSGTASSNNFTTPSASDVMAYRFIGQANGDGAGFLTFLNDQVNYPILNDQVTYPNSKSYGGYIKTNYTMAVQNNAGTWSGTLYYGYSVNGTPLTTLSNTTYSTANKSSQTSGYIGISASYESPSDHTSMYANPINVQWFRLRQLPPSATAPSATADSIVTVPNHGFLPHLR